MLNKKDEHKMYNDNFIEACNNAINGIIYSATTQTNIRKQLVIAVVVMLLSLFYGLDTPEYMCLTFEVFFVIFAEMINTAIIVNCSRGGIVNEADLIEALNNGEIAGAGLDVFVGEELYPGNPLLDAKNLIFSPHSAAQTREAVINMATMCVEGCKAVCEGKKWKLVANPKVYEHEKWKDAEWA